MSNVNKTIRYNRHKDNRLSSASGTTMSSAIIPGSIEDNANETKESNNTGELSRLAPEPRNELPKEPIKIEEQDEEEAPKEEEGGDDGEGDDDDDDDDEPTVKYTYTVKHEDGTSELIEEEWSAQHCKICYLMSLYAKCALTSTDNESWIRNIPLVVLIYEGIVKGIIDFDYAPCSVLITQEGKSKRVWLNITQEGKAAVDDLREKELINGLKLSTEDFQPVTAFQVSKKGLDFLKQVPMEMKTGKKVCYIKRNNDQNIYF